MPSHAPWKELPGVALPADLAAQKGSQSLPCALPAPVESWLQDNRFSLIIVGVCFLAVVFSCLNIGVISDYNRQWVIYGSVIGGIIVWITAKDRQEWHRHLGVATIIITICVAVNLNIDWSEVKEVYSVLSKEFWIQVFIIYFATSFYMKERRKGQLLITLAWAWVPGCILYNWLGMEKINGMRLFITDGDFFCCVWFILWLFGGNLALVWAWAGADEIWPEPLAEIKSRPYEPPPPPAPIDNIID